MKCLVAITVKDLATGANRMAEHARNLEFSAALKLIADQVSNSDRREGELSHDGLRASYRIS